MILPGLLWLMAGFLTGTLYADKPYLTLRFRRIGIVILELCSIAMLAIVFSADWRLWAVPVIIEAYKALNAIRFLAGRLPLPQLNSVTLRAHSWLGLMQFVTLAAAWIIKHTEGLTYAVATLVTIQLVSALVLLRATLHTWRHAEPFRRAKPLTDKQLPSMSVLIPARNETKALQACLDRLVASDYPKLEIIVLDDNSADRRTPEIIRSYANKGIRFIQSSADTPHWLAKNQAYQRLRQEASGELLLFCGVDAQFSPHTLRRLVETLLARKKEMLSVLPLRAAHSDNQAALLQPMRYYWELCLPRRFFKRPPVLSTCWLIRAQLYDRIGGMAAISRSVTPEAYFARQAVVTDAYSFIRSNTELGFYSAKPRSEQYATSVRTRYPQLHRRLELVAVAALAESFVCLLPAAGLLTAGFYHWPFTYCLMWGLTVTCLIITYYFVAAATRLNNPATAWLLMPLAFVGDIIMLHISLYKYEFSTVTWKGRDVAATVMRQLIQTDEQR